MGSTLGEEIFGRPEREKKDLRSPETDLGQREKRETDESRRGSKQSLVKATMEGSLWRPDRGRGTGGPTERVRGTHPDQ